MKVMLVEFEQEVTSLSVVITRQSREAGGDCFQTSDCRADCSHVQLIFAYYQLL